MSDDLLFILLCCGALILFILGAIVWEAVRSHFLYRYHAATREEKDIAHRMEQEYRTRSRDVRRGK